MPVLDPSFLPTPGPQSHLKLENYAQLYAKYTHLVQLQADAMRHDSQRMQGAYNQVAAEFTAEQTFAQNKSDSSYVLADLNEYANRCGVHPQTFEDHVRISFAASGFVQVLMQFVIGELNPQDMGWVMARATQLLSGNHQPIPTFAPAVCKFRSDDAATVSVSDSDIDYWRLNPQELVGKCFTTTEEIMRQTFLVQDYYVKYSGQEEYEVVFEDTGLEDLNRLDPESVLTMVKDANLVL